jgi:hypothetical protein
MTVRAQVAAVLAVLGLAAIVDFASRVYVPRTGAERDARLDVAIVPGEMLSLAEARQRLQSWLPGQDASAAANPDDVASGVVENADLPDRGKLGGWVFVLRGVFDVDAGPPFAVLEVAPETGGAAERHEVIAGNDIKGVRVERIAGRRVSLSDGDESIRLALFLDPDNETDAANESND